MTKSNFSKGQLNSLIFLRLFIGWHFLYEGVLKLYNPEWTSKAYLISAEGFLKSVFIWMSGEGMVGFIDTINIVILMFVGVALLLGFFEKPAAIAGFGLLFLYYLAHPAFPGLNQGITEGNYWIINKNLIEAVALLIIYFFPTSSYFGLQGIIKSTKTNQTEGQPT